MYVIASGMNPPNRRVKWSAAIINLEIASSLPLLAMTYYDTFLSKSVNSYAC